MPEVTQRSGQLRTRLASARTLRAPPAPRRAKARPAPLAPRRLVTMKGGLDLRLGGNEAAPSRKGTLGGLLRELRQRGCSCHLRRALAARSAAGAPPPQPWQEVAGRGRRGRRMAGALSHWPRAAPTAGRGTRGRAGARPDTPPPAGALHLAAAGERRPRPCPARRWPLRPPPPPPLPRGGRTQAASDPSCGSSLLFFPLPVWHGHH